MRILAFALAMLPGAVGAEVLQHRYISENNVWQVETNEHGAVLTSAWQTVYMGNSCDLFGTVSGGGSWSWANAGFMFRFQNGDTAFFARQDTPIAFDHGQYCAE